MIQDPADYFRGLSAAYTDNIRATDFKANIVMFFLSIVMGPVIFNHDKFPPFLTLPVLVAPFLLIFFCLFVALLPRYPRRGRANFLVSRTATPADFKFKQSSGDGNEAAQLQLRCAVLSDILYWKTLCLRIAFIACIASVVAATLLLIVYGH
jgi:hypothetical protein